MKGRAILACLATLLAGCEHATSVADGPIALGAKPVTISFAFPIQAVGPTRELCLVMSPDDADRLAPGGYAGTSPAVRAVLLSPDGRLDTIGASVGASADRRGRSVVCFWDHGLANPNSWAGHERAPLRATYTGVVLSSLIPVTVRGVRWWSGQRQSFL